MKQELTTNTPVQIRALEELKKDNRLPALVAAVESVKAPESVKEEVALQFTDFFERIERYTTPAFALVVADETEKEKMFDAREAMVALKALERTLTAKHGELKEDALRYGQTLDATKRAALALITPAVEHLKAQAEFIERKEAARIEALRSERYNLILPCIELVPIPWPEWGTMTETEFQDNLAYFQEKARQIEAERVAKIEREKAEREELERLRREAATKDAELRDARLAQWQAEQQALRMAEAAQLSRALEAQKEQAITEQEPATQTDREKLRAYSTALVQYPPPTIQDPEMRKVLQAMRILINKIDLYVEEKTAIQ